MKNVPLAGGTLTFLLFTMTVQAQWTRVNYPFPSLPIISEVNSGCGVSFFDVNEDGWDDLTFCTNGGPTLYYQNNQGYFELTYIFPNTGNAKSCIWADLDEDGDNDLIVSRYDLPLQIFRNIGNNQFETADYMVGDTGTSGNRWMGVSVADYNRDAYLDIAVANFTQSNPNLLLTNSNGDYLSPVMYSDLNSNLKTSFQPAWVDINNDHFSDIFFANDHDLGNEYYQQNSNGYFEDLSISSNLYTPAFAMSAAFADFDNDLDEDLFISDSQLSAYPLLQNDGNGIFTQILNQNLTFNLEGWGSLWIDADNDPWQDLFICTRGGGVENQDFNNVFMLNDSAVLIDTPVPLMTDLTNGYYSNAKGDFNNDGRSDIVITPENTGTISLFQNTSINTHNFIKFKLNGRLSNRNGIGSKYYCYFNGHTRSGYLQCGENYLSQNSQNILIGIGEAMYVDSLIIDWPSGVVDKYYNIERSTFAQLTEAETWGGITFNSSPCAGSTIEAQIHPWPIINWNNGDHNSTTTYNSGLASVTVSTGFGHSISFEENVPETTPIEIHRVIEHPICPNASNGMVYYWTTDLNGVISDEMIYNGLGPGFHNMSFTYYNECVYEDNVELIPQSNPYIENIQATPSCPNLNNGRIELIITGGVAPYDNLFQDTILYVDLGPGNYGGVIVDALQCPVEWSTEIQANDIVTNIIEPTCVYKSNGIVSMDYVMINGMIETFTEDSLSHGNHTIYFESTDGCPLVWTGNLGYQDSMQVYWENQNPICQEDSVLFNPTVNVNFQTLNWYFLEPGEWLSPNTYHVALESPAGCIWDSTFHIIATTSPEISSNITYPTDIGPGNIEVQVEGEYGPYTCLWTQENVYAWNISFSENGIYPFTITDGYNCSFDSIVSVNMTAAVTDLNTHPSWQWNGQEIKFTGLTNCPSIQVFDTSGRLILAEKNISPGQSFTINVSGTYLLFDSKNKFRFIK